MDETTYRALASYRTSSGDTLVNTFLVRRGGDLAVVVQTGHTRPDGRMPDHLHGLSASRPLTGRTFEAAAREIRADLDRYVGSGRTESYEGKEGTSPACDALAEVLTRGHIMTLGKHPLSDGPAPPRALRGA